MATRMNALTGGIQRDGFSGSTMTVIGQVWNSGACGLARKKICKERGGLMRVPEDCVDLVPDRKEDQAAQDPAKAKKKVRRK